MDSSFSKQRVKIAGAVVAAALLVVAGVVALNNATADAPLMPLEHALAAAENTNTPMSQLPDESMISTPKGWQIESDEPVAGAGEESTEDGDDLIQEGEPRDEEMDFPAMVEEDEQGKFVAELEEDVLADGVDDDEVEENAEGMEVAEDKKKGLRCKNRRLKKCVARRKCTKLCKRRCRRVVKRRCKNRKFCRCYCKFRKNKKAARKCVVYKRKICKPVGATVCNVRCKGFCRRIPHCYCCKGPKQVTTECRRTCRRIIRKTKCARCRCRPIECYRTCRMVCKK